MIHGELIIFFITLGKLDTKLGLNLFKKALNKKFVRF
jgi:hypothetical protein